MTSTDLRNTVRCCPAHAAAPGPLRSVLQVPRCPRKKAVSYDGVAAGPARHLETNPLKTISTSSALAERRQVPGLIRQSRKLIADLK